VETHNRSSDLPESERLFVPAAGSYAEDMEEGPQGIMAIGSVVGTRWCGEVDRVPGVLHVATLFFYVLGVPLIPLQSWIVLEDLRGSKTAASAAIGWDVKSILMAIVRVVLFLATCAVGAAGLGGLIGLALGRNGWLLATILCGIAIGLTAALRFTYRMDEASIPRAEELAMRAGFTEAEAHSIADDIRMAALQTLGEGELHESFQMIPCPGCGREVARTTRICPRCEHRLG
jgi:hypothetical protein